jgi:TldD protein
MDAGVIETIGYPNITVDPAASSATIESLIAATKNGLYFSKGLWASMDPPLMNGMYGGQMVYEITNGKIGALVKHAALTARTTDLWKSADLLGGASTVVDTAAYQYKGDPMEVYFSSVRAPAARIKQVNVINTYRKERDDE